MDGTNGLARAGDGALTFTDEQRQMIRDTYANGASDAEFAVLMEIAKARRLNPLLRQIHFVKRWTPKGDVWSPQVSIDGLRAIAQRTGLYDGQDEPRFEEAPDGSLRLCKVAVYRKDWQRPAVGVAYWTEYVQTTRDKQTGKKRPTEMWERMPHVMLSKVAEAIALRKAFPEDMAGLYTGDEMAQADNDRPRYERPPVDAEGPRGEPARREPEPPQLEAAARPEPPPEAPKGDDDLGLAPAELEGFLARVGEVELPGESVAVWMKHRAEVAKHGNATREYAWKALLRRTEQVGKMKNAQHWLAKAVKEEDARRAAAASHSGESAS